MKSTRRWGGNRRAGLPELREKVHAVHAGLEATLKALRDLEGWHRDLYAAAGRVNLHAAGLPLLRISENVGVRQLLLGLSALRGTSGPLEGLIPANTVEVRW